jgi:hypothetical protein
MRSTLLLCCVSEAVGWQAHVREKSITLAPAAAPAAAVATRPWLVHSARQAPTPDPAAAAASLDLLLLLLLLLLLVLPCCCCCC